MVNGGISLTEVSVELQESENLEWVSLMSNSIKSIENTFSPNWPRASALLLQQNYELQTISDSFFARMIGLKLLNLSSTSITVLPDSVSILTNLHTLLLSECYNLVFIPSLAKLTKLRELDIRGCNEMQKLPEGMEKLASLELVDVSGTRVEGIPSGLFCKLCNHQSFSRNEFIVAPWALEIVRLGHLQHLTIRYSNITWVNQGVSSDGFNQWRTYSVDRREGNEYLNRVVSVGTDVSFLVPESVEHLWFSKWNFGVRSLLDAVPSLVGAAALECCTLRGCVGVEFIISDKWLALVECIRHLKLEELEDFVGLVRELHPCKTVSFNSLRKLDITNCPKVKKQLLLNVELPNLEEIRVANCGQMEQVFAAAHGETVKFPKLRYLHMNGLPELTRISDSNVFFPDLLHLQIRECPKLKSLGFLCNNLPSLQHLSISDCRQIEGVFDANQYPNLKTMLLHQLPKLPSFSSLVPRNT